MNSIEIPDDAQPMAPFVDRRNLLPYQNAALADDFKKQRYSLPPDTVVWAMVDPQDPRQRAWTGPNGPADAQEIRTHTYVVTVEDDEGNERELRRWALYEEAWPVIEGKLVPAHTRPVKGKEDKQVRTVAVTRESVKGMRINIIGRNTPFMREVLTMVTDHCRTFTYDPERPTDMTRHDCARERYLGVSGSQKKVRGFSGEYQYSWDDRAWWAIQDAAEAMAIADSVKNGKDQFDTVAPEMYAAVKAPPPQPKPKVKQ